MLERGVAVAGLERAAAPDALMTVAVEDAPEAFGARKVGREA
jgi:hypothetical protein